MHEVLSCLMHINSLQLLNRQFTCTAFMLNNFLLKQKVITHTYTHTQRTYKLIHVELDGYVRPIHTDHAFHIEILVICRGLDIIRLLGGQISVVAFQELFPVFVAENRKGSTPPTFKYAPSF